MPKRANDKHRLADLIVAAMNGGTPQNVLWRDPGQDCLCMKKPPRKKRISPRRKPLRSRGPMRPRYTVPGQASFDHMQARDRAMRERMPPEVREEWDRLIELPSSEDDELDPAHEARMDEILEQYEDAASEEDIARHVADIVREREAGQAAPELFPTE